MAFIPRHRAEQDIFDQNESFVGIVKAQPVTDAFFQAGAVGFVVGLEIVVGGAAGAAKFGVAL